MTTNNANNANNETTGIKGTSAVRALRVTINEVAQHANVSRQTVSNTLNHPDRVNPATRQHVLESIDLLGYRPSASSQQLQRQRAGAIGFEVNALGATRSDVTNPFLVALSVAAPRHRLQLLPFGSDDAEPALDGYIDTVHRHLVDAFVLVDTHHGDPRPQWLTERSIPWVAFGRIWNDAQSTSWVDVDGYAGTADAVDHLVIQGYERIGYLGWPAGSAVGDDRRQGWSDATAKHHIMEAPLAECEQGIAEATAAADALLHEVGRGGAVVCASDMLAIGVLHATLARGWVIGPDLGLVGFDGSSTALLSGITTLVQPLERIADHCLALLDDVLDGGTPPDSGSIFQPTLITGESTNRTTRGTTT